MCSCRADGRAGLGFRRLAIIDLRHGANQPMPNEDGAVRVVFNGEIYNFRAARAARRSAATGSASHARHRNHRPLYEEHGAGLRRTSSTACSPSRSGTSEQRRLLLARDRAGKKPLFYYRDGRRVVFGSEIKAIFAHPTCTIDDRRGGAAAYFIYGYVPHPATLYRGVTQVEPGTRGRRSTDGAVTNAQATGSSTFPQAGPDASGRATAEARDARPRRW